MKIGIGIIESFIHRMGASGYKKYSAVLQFKLKCDYYDRKREGDFPSTGAQRGARPAQAAAVKCLSVCLWVRAK
jgi:hypothetical protein